MDFINSFFGYTALQNNWVRIARSLVLDEDVSGFTIGLTAFRGFKQSDIRFNIAGINEVLAALDIPLSVSYAFADKVEIGISSVGSNMLVDINVDGLTIVLTSPFPLRETTVAFPRGSGDTARIKEHLYKRLLIQRDNDIKKINSILQDVFGYMYTEAFKRAYGEGGGAHAKGESTADFRRNPLRDKWRIAAQALLFPTDPSSNEQFDPNSLGELETMLDDDSVKLTLTNSHIRFEEGVYHHSCDPLSFGVTIGRLSLSSAPEAWSAPSPDGLIDSFRSPLCERAVEKEIARDFSVRDLAVYMSTGGDLWVPPTAMNAGDVNGIYKYISVNSIKLLRQNLIVEGRSGLNQNQKGVRPPNIHTQYPNLTTIEESSRGASPKLMSSPGYRSLFAAPSVISASSIHSQYQQQRTFTTNNNFIPSQASPSSPKPIQIHWIIRHVKIVAQMGLWAPNHDLSIYHKVIVDMTKNVAKNPTHLPGIRRKIIIDKNTKKRVPIESDVIRYQVGDQKRETELYFPSNVSLPVYKPEASFALDEYNFLRPPGVTFKSNPQNNHYKNKNDSTHCSWTPHLKDAAEHESPLEPPIECSQLVPIRRVQIHIEDIVDVCLNEDIIRGITRVYSLKPYRENLRMAARHRPSRRPLNRVIAEQSGIFHDANISRAWWAYAKDLALAEKQRRPEHSLRLEISRRVHQKSYIVEWKKKIKRTAPRLGEYITVEDTQLLRAFETQYPSEMVSVWRLLAEAETEFERSRGFSSSVCSSQRLLLGDEAEIQDATEVTIDQLRSDVGCTRVELPIQDVATRITLASFELDPRQPIPPIICFRELTLTERFIVWGQVFLDLRAILRPDRFMPESQCIASALGPRSRWQFQLVRSRLAAMHETLGPDSITSPAFLSWLYGPHHPTSLRIANRNDLLAAHEEINRHEMQISGTDAALAITANSYWPLTRIIHSHAAASRLAGGVLPDDSRELMGTLNNHLPWLETALDPRLCELPVNMRQVHFALVANCIRISCFDNRGNKPIRTVGAAVKGLSLGFRHHYFGLRVNACIRRAEINDLRYNSHGQLLPADDTRLAASLSDYGRSFMYMSLMNDRDVNDEDEDDKDFDFMLKNPKAAKNNDSKKLNTSSFKVSSLRDQEDNQYHQQHVEHLKSFFKRKMAQSHNPMIKSPPRQQGSSGDNFHKKMAHEGGFTFDNGVKSSIKEALERKREQDIRNINDPDNNDVNYFSFDQLNNSIKSTTETRDVWDNLLKHPQEVLREAIISTAKVLNPLPPVTSVNAEHFVKRREEFRAASKAVIATSSNLSNPSGLPIARVQSTRTNPELLEAIRKTNEDNNSNYSDPMVKEDSKLNMSPNYASLPFIASPWTKDDDLMLDPLRKFDNYKRNILNFDAISSKIHPVSKMANDTENVTENGLSKSQKIEKRSNRKQVDFKVNEATHEGKESKEGKQTRLVSNEKNSSSSVSYNSKRKKSEIEDESDRRNLTETLFSPKVVNSKEDTFLYDTSAHTINSFENSNDRHLSRAELARWLDILHGVIEEPMIPSSDSVAWTHLQVTYSAPNAMALPIVASLFGSSPPIHIDLHDQSTSFLFSELKRMKAASDQAKNLISHISCAPSLPSKPLTYRPINIILSDASLEKKTAADQGICLANLDGDCCSQCSCDSFYLEVQPDDDNYDAIQQHLNKYGGDAFSTHHINNHDDHIIHHKENNLVLPFSSVLDSELQQQQHQMRYMPVISQRIENSRIDLQTLYNANVFAPPSYVGLPILESARLEALDNARRGSFNLLHLLKGIGIIPSQIDEERKELSSNVTSKSVMPRRTLPRVLGGGFRDGQAYIGFGSADLNGDEDVIPAADRFAIDHTNLVARLNERVWRLDSAVHASRVFLHLTLPAVEITFSQRESSLVSSTTDSRKIGTRLTSPNHHTSGVPFRTKIPALRIRVETVNGPLFNLLHKELSAQMDKKMNHENVQKGIFKMRVKGLIEQKKDDGQIKDHFLANIVKLILPNYQDLKRKVRKDEWDFAANGGSMIGNMNSSSSSNATTDVMNRIQTSSSRSLNINNKNFKSDEGSQSIFSSKGNENNHEAKVDNITDDNDIRLRIDIGGTEIEMQQDIASAFVIFCLLRGQLYKCFDEISKELRQS